MPTFDVFLNNAYGEDGRFLLNGGAMIRTVLQNQGPSTMFLRTYAEESQSVSTVTSAATTTGDAYITVANVSGVKQGMVVTSEAVGLTFAQTAIVRRLDGNRVYLYGGEALTMAAGVAVSFEFTHYGTMDIDYPRGIRLAPGEVYTFSGQPGSYPGKGGMLLISENQSVVSIIAEEN